MPAFALIDPDTGKPYKAGGGDGTGGTAVDFEILAVQDANEAYGLLRMEQDGSRTFTTLAGDAWSPVSPVRPWAAPVVTGGATSEKQDEIISKVTYAYETNNGLLVLINNAQADQAKEARQIALNTAFGTQNDAAATTSTIAASGISIWKGILAALLARLPASLGGKTAALSLSVTPATDANLAKETYTVTPISVATSATAGTYTAFGSQACTSLDIVNNTGVDIAYTRGGTGVAIRVPAGTSRLVQGITNANQIQVTNVSATTNYTVTAEAFA